MKPRCGTVPRKKFVALGKSKRDLTTGNCFYSFLSFLSLFFLFVSCYFSQKYMSLFEFIPAETNGSEVQGGGKVAVRGEEVKPPTGNMREGERCLSIRSRLR